MEQIEKNWDGNLCRCTGYRPILDAGKTFASDAKSCPNAPATGRVDPVEGVAMVVSDSLAKIAPFADGDAQMNAPPEVAFPASLKTKPESLILHGPSVTWHQPVTLDALLQLKQEHTDAKLVGGNTEIGIETKFKHREYRTQISILQVEELAKIEVIGPDAFPEIAKGASAGNGGIAIGGSATLSAILVFCEKLIATRPSHETQPLKAIHAMGEWFASTQIRNVATLAGNIATASPISDMNPTLISLNAVLEIQAAEQGGGSGRRTRLVPMNAFFKGYRQVDLAPHEMITRIFVPFSGVFEYTLPYKQARRRDDDISIVCAGMRVRLRPSSGSAGWVIDDSSFGFGGMAATTVSAPKTQQACKGLPWDESSLEKIYAALASDLPLPDNVPGGMAVFRRTLCTSFFFKFYIKVSGLLQQDLELFGKGKHTALLAALPKQLPCAPTVDEKVLSAQESFVTDHHLRPVSHGTQAYAVEAELETVGTGTTDGKDRGVVGQPLMHKSAYEQVCGSAMYTDDLNRGDSLVNNAGACSATGAKAAYDDSTLASTVLEVAFIGSTEACAKLLSIDATAALALPGVIACYTADDVPGHNEIGAIVKDELLFRKVGGMVESVGQPLGIIVATTRELAQKASRLVKVEYAKSKPSKRKATGESKVPIFTIEDAIREDSFFDSIGHTIAEGDVDAALASKGSGDEEVVVVEGEMRIGGQEHFYLECNAAYCVPGEGNSMDIVSSTQNPTKTQRFVASCLGVSEHLVVSRCKRMGGGFGGKETRSAFVACAAAIAAHHLGRPTRISLDRNEDMAIIGMRHAFVGKYKAGVRKNGELVGLDLKMYSNGGFSHDLSVPVMDRALFHCDNVYNWHGAFRANGRVAKTGITSNTAFRGFGGPQGMLVTEGVMDHLARAINMDPQQLRQINLYRETDHTPFGQRLNDGSCGNGTNAGGHIRRLWDEMLDRADVVARKEKVAEYNKKHRWRKRGFNMLVSKFGINFTAKFMNQGGALVHVYTDGTVLVSHGGTEMGQGLHTKMIQVAARCLGIRDSSKVHVAETSTDKVANTNPSAASLSTDLYGMAVLNACQKIRKRLEPLAEEMGLGKWGGKDFDFAKLANAAFFSRINLSAQGFYIVPDDRCGYEYEKQVTAEETAAAVATGGNENTPRGTPFNYFTCGVACSEVEVDILTGDMHLVRTDILMDLGCSINPVIDIGQVEGAFVQVSTPPLAQYCTHDTIQHTIHDTIQHTIHTAHHSYSTRFAPLPYLHLYSHRLYSHRLYSHRLYSHRLYSHRLYSHRLYSYRLYSHRLALLFLLGLRLVHDGRGGLG
jgi:xanthine dehydrogenase/oxidase